jgi:hypothetical protein
MEAIAGPELRELSPAEGRLTVFKRAYELVDDEFGQVSKSEKIKIAEALQRIALLLWRLQDGKGRDPLPKTVRYSLAMSGTLYCWICGVRFSPLAVRAFIEGRKLQGRAHLLVDFIYPRGRNKADLSITVDHIRPVAAGGTNDPDNLRLCCSWCNTIKSDSLDIYRYTGYRGEYSHSTLGDFALPNLGWVVRLLAVSNGCFVCGLDQSKRPMVVAAGGAVRKLNPAYLRTYCEDCDPWKDDRMVPVSSLPR